MLTDKDRSNLTRLHIIAGVIDALSMKHGGLELLNKHFDTEAMHVELDAIGEALAPLDDAEILEFVVNGLLADQLPSCYRGFEVN